MKRLLGSATALLLVAGATVAVQAPLASAAATPGAGALAAPAQPRADLDALAQRVDRVESLRDVKTVQRTFAQLAQFGEWGEMADLFSANGTLQWGDEVATGHDEIEAWLDEDAGDMDGVTPGSLHFMMLDDPVVSLSPDGTTAQGRWNGMRFMGNGSGETRIDGGIYENAYVLEDGDWRISDLHFYPQFEGDHATGWRNVGGVPLTNVPYHFTTDSVGVPLPAPSTAAPKATGTVKTVAARIQALNDEDDVRNVQNSMGYYVDRRMWTDVVDLFASEATYEITGVGTFTGVQGVRAALEQTMGAEGLSQYVMNDHPIWALTVDVDDRGLTATSRGLEMGMMSDGYRSASWSFSVFRNTFVKEDGLWKLQKVHLTPLVVADYYDGWGDGGTGGAQSHEALPFLEVDRSVNPLTGAPDDISELSRKLSRSEAYDGAENISNSYSTYLNDLDYAKIGATTAELGFKETPFIGYYRTPEKIAEVGGRNGPPPTIRTSIAIHRNPQPVILVSHDGRSAQLRARLLQYGTSINGGGGFGGGMYLNQYVLEDGIWRTWDLTIDEFYWSSTGGWAGGWANAQPRDPSLPAPPPSPVIQTYPPGVVNSDLGERKVGFRGGVEPYIVWPDILPMWFNYRNLVSGRVPDNYQIDCTPCGFAPSWSMQELGYQLPPDGPNVDGVEVYP
jgi:hypothetical protein